MAEMIELIIDVSVTVHFMALHTAYILISSSDSPVCEFCVCDVLSLVTVFMKHRFMNSEKC